MSAQQAMPDFLPDMAEAGTLNVPGIAGLSAGIAYVRQEGVDRIFRRERQQAEKCGKALEKMGLQTFVGDHQAGTVSFVPPVDCEDAARILGEGGIAVRAGLHCAPLAHESAGTQDTGTVRVSYGHDAAAWQTGNFMIQMEKMLAQS